MVVQTSQTYPVAAPDAGSLAVSHGGAGPRTYPALVRIDAGVFQPPEQYTDSCDKGKSWRNRAGSCGQAAVYLRVWLHTSLLGKFLIPRSNGVHYCEAHAKQAAKRGGLQLLDSLDAFTAYHTRVIAFESSYAAWLKSRDQWLFERQREAYARQEQETLEKYGRILRLSGSQGRLYQLADGSYLCVMRDGSEVKPCCPREGGRIIKNQIRGRVMSGHTDGCVNG